jgi:hypothetical protein
MTTYPIGVPPRVELVIFSNFVFPSETVGMINLNNSIIKLIYLRQGITLKVVIFYFFLLKSTRVCSHILFILPIRRIGYFSGTFNLPWFLHYYQSEYQESRIERSACIFAVRVGNFSFCNYRFLCIP